MLIVVGFALFFFIGISAMLARALAATGTERSRVLDVAEAQARGDARAVLSATPACARQPACVTATTTFVDELKRGGRVEILQYEPSVQLPLTRVTGTGRVAWRAGSEPARSCSACASAATARCPARRSSCSRSLPRSATTTPAPMTGNFPPEHVLRFAVMARLRFLLPIFALLVLFPAAAHAQKPDEQALYQDGPDGRYLLDGDWLFRLDATDQGVKQRWMRSASKAGWSRVKVPNVWNLGDASNESMAGGIGWYRKDFELPSADSALEWAFRFESVNYRARVWLNGAPIGENAGAYLPFEVQAANALKRRGKNRLVVRVDSRRLDSDFPPARTNADGVPSGGWWNYSGIQREVYLKKLDTVDFQKVQVRPEIACGTCDASVRMDLNLRNVTARGQRVTLTGKFGDRNVNFGSKTIGADGDRRVHQADQDRQAAPVVAAEPEPLRRLLHRPRRRGQGRRLQPAQRHPLDQGLPGQALPQRRADQHPRHGAARGLQGGRLRDRQRAPRGAGEAHQGSRRHGAAHALPVPPVHA